MGRVASSLIRRPLKNWNVENRAQRLLDRQDRPSSAPKHPSSKEYIDTFSKEHPEILDELTKKDPGLDKRLEGLVVNPEKFGEILSKKKPLPENRTQMPDLEFGYLEPEVIRPGRFTIKQAMEFLGNHYSDPETYSASVIAKEYNLNKDQVGRVLQYFSIFLVQIPGQATEHKDMLPESKAFNPRLLNKQVDSEKKSDSSKFSRTISSSPETK